MNSFKYLCSVNDYVPHEIYWNNLQSVMSTALTPAHKMEVVATIQRLNSTNSCDVNGFILNGWMLMANKTKCFQYLWYYLLKRYKHFIGKLRFPVHPWDKKGVVSIFQKDSPCQSRNYRPILILRMLSNIGKNCPWKLPKLYRKFLNSVSRTVWIKEKYLPLMQLKISHKTLSMDWKGRNTY